MIIKRRIGTGYTESGIVVDSCDWYGLSDDDKPTEDVATNDVFLELDTGNFKYFDGTEWQQVGGGADASV